MASHESISRTFIGTVVCVDLVGYSKRPVDQQNAIKAHFNKCLSQVLAGIRPEDRIILDTGDGVAISFLGDPGESLEAGLALQNVLGSSAAKLGADDGSGPARIGINLGPVKVAMDMNGRPNIIGDGINVATCIMGFAKPGQIAVSRSFHDMLSRMSDAHAELFRFDGVRTDANVREHEVYVVRESALESRRAAPAGNFLPCVVGPPDRRNRFPAARPREGRRCGRIAVGGDRRGSARARETSPRAGTGARRGRRPPESRAGACARGRSARRRTGNATGRDQPGARKRE